MNISAQTSLPLEPRGISVLVTGASGFLGSYLVVYLRSRGYKVIAALRNASENIGSDTIEVGDIVQRADWTTVLSGVDVVIHTVAKTHSVNQTNDSILRDYRKVNVDASCRLALGAKKSGVKRFIFVSTVKVLGEETEPGKTFNDKSLPSPQDAYGITKHEAELALQAIFSDGNCDLVIIRPTLIYGPGVKGNLNNLKKLVAFGIPLPFGSVKNKRSVCSIDNLCSLLSVCIHHPNASDGIFLAADSEAISLPQIVELISCDLARSPRFFSMPVGVLFLITRLIGSVIIAKKLFCDLTVDASHAADLLGWAPEK